jgi:hypothetical protein
MLMSSFCVCVGSFVSDKVTQQQFVKQHIVLYIIVPKKMVGKLEVT